MMGKKPRRDLGPVWSIVASPDLILGVLVGGAVAIVPAISSASREGLQSMFIGIAGVGAGVATLILTAMAVLVGVVSPAYAKMLSQTKSGVAGAARPFQIVAQVAAAASAAGLVSANVIPILGNNSWLMWGVTAVPFILVLWSVFGCVQVSRQLAYHWSNACKADELDPRKPDAKARRGTSSSLKSLNSE